MIAARTPNANAIRTPMAKALSASAKKTPLLSACSAPRLRRNDSEDANDAKSSDVSGEKSRRFSPIGGVNVKSSDSDERLRNARTPSQAMSSVLMNTNGMYVSVY